MATGPASRNSTASEIDLAFLNLNLSEDCETWLTGPNEGENQTESISTQEWLDGALRNSQYDHTKLHRIMQSQKKQRKRLVPDLPSHPSSLLTSVTEEHDKASSSVSDSCLLTPGVHESDAEDEFFDAETNFEEEAAAECKFVAPLNNQNHGLKSYQRVISPRNTNASKPNTYIKPNVTTVSQASARRVNNSNELQNMNKALPQVSHDQSKQLSSQAMNGSKVSPRRDNTASNDKISPKPSVGTQKIPAVNNSMSKSGIRPPTYSANTISRQQHIPANVNTSPQPSLNTEINKNISKKCDASFLEMSRKIEEQEKKLLEEALQGKKHESRPSSSASTNGEIIVKEECGIPSANLPTSKSVDFKGALRLTAAGRSTSTRIPMYGRTASVSSTLQRIPKPRPNIVTRARPPSPKDASNDPWGDNCF